MCGIVGIYYFDPQRSVVARDLQAMADRINHRGPDDAGYHFEANVGIGMRRLSIIDLAGGHQPIYSSDGRYVIVYNGEVYNFKEKRSELEKRGHTFATQSDTEVVLNLYAEHGPAFVDHLNGMFAVAIWDRRQRELVVVRDRIGIKPLYYYRDADQVIFASEIKAILAHPAVVPVLDRQGLGAYLRYGFTPAPHTLFKGISKLEAAHLLRLGSGAVVNQEYWHLSYRDKFEPDEAVLKERLHELLSDSVQRQMIADVPLGAFLSGGFDSSGIVHLMSGADERQVNTYSIGFGRGFEAYNELDAAKRFALDYGTAHHEILVTPDVTELLPRLVAALDEPVADSSFLVTYLVAELARDTVKVILSGVGGDELFGGYRRYLSAPLARHMRLVPRTLRVGVLERALRHLSVDRNSGWRNVLRLTRAYLASADLPVAQQYGQYTKVFDDLLITELAPEALPGRDFYSQLFEQCDSNDLLDKLMYFDLKMSLPEQLLMLTDKMTMAVSLEARVPLLDHRVVEFAARIPAHLKIKGVKLRYLQKQTFRGHLPRYVYEQKKKGFGAPIGTWLRNELADLVGDLLGESQLRSQNIFDSRCVARLIDDHYARRADYTDQLLALLVFQLWFRSYGLS
jgi:asparagine synthase (glutamine-hydrolysing)